MSEQKLNTTMQFSTLLMVVVTAVLGAAAVGLCTYLVIQTTPVRAPGIKPTRGKQQLDCTVLIIGSGFAGSFAAYQLAPDYKNRLCLVERLNRDGGRIYDVDEYPNGPVFGAGALRVTRQQPTMLALADELNITLQEVEEEVEMWMVRGRNFYRGSTVHDDASVQRMCHQLFPTVNCSVDGGTSTEQIMYSMLTKLRHERPHFLEEHPDFPSLLVSLFGEEGFAFFREFSFHSLLTSVAHHGALDYVAAEDSTFGNLAYPVGGMSQYIIRMLGKAKNHGMRIYHNEPVLEISTSSDERFTIETPTFTIRASHVLCSIDPLGFANVTGDVADKVRSAPEFCEIAPKASVTVAAWWDERWWERSSLHGTEHNLTRVTSHASCFNGMEIPRYPYGMEQNVTRVVYDDGACVHTWRTLLSDGGPSSEKLTSTVVKSLQQVFHDVDIPRPRTIKGHIHENAWHFQDPKSKRSNQEVFEWSVQPIPYLNFALIGEAYNLNLSGWCDAALKSTMTVMARFYNITNYPCLQDPSSPATCSLDLTRRIKQGSKRIRLRLP